MASSPLKAHGFNVNDVSLILAGTADPSVAGVSAPEGSLYGRYVDGAGEVWLKSGATDTSWTVLSTGVNDDAFQNTFMGKSASGAETTEYTSDNGTTQSNNVVTDGESLLDSVGKLDAEIGAAVTATNYVSDQAVNLNIDSLDAQVKANADAIGATAGALAWKPAVYVITGDQITTGAAPTTFTDDESTTVAAPADGQYILSTFDNTLWEVSGSNIAPAAMSSNDTFMVTNTLTDSPGGEEGPSIWSYVDSALVKISDVDWNVASAIDVSSAFTTVVAGKTPGTAVPNSASVEDAIAQIAATQGDSLTDGNYVAAANTTQENLAALDTAVNNANSAIVSSSLGSAVHATATLDTVDYTANEGVEWSVLIKETAGTGRYICKIMAVNDGAGGNLDFTEYAIGEIGATLNPALEVSFSGTDMLLTVSTDVAATVSAKRINLD